MSLDSVFLIPIAPSDEHHLNRAKARQELPENRCRLMTALAGILQLRAPQSVENWKLPVRTPWRTAGG